MSTVVTVGSTVFEELIRVCGSAEFLRLLLEVDKCKKLVLQVGRGVTQIPGAELIEDRRKEITLRGDSDNLCGSLTTNGNENEFTGCKLLLQKGDSSSLKVTKLSSSAPKEEEIEEEDYYSGSGMIIYVFRFSSRFEKVLSGASLVICHAGAGSLLGAFSREAPCRRVLTVANQKLMNNHQKELADVVEAAGYAYTAPTPADIPRKMREIKIEETSSRIPFPKTDRTGFFDLIEFETGVRPV